MIRDAQTALWEAAALTSSAVCTNPYDVGAPVVTSGTAPDPSTGETIGVILTVGVAADHTTGNETYEFDLITATATDLTTGQLVITQNVLLYSQLTAGAIFFFAFPPNSITQRYIGIKYVGGGTTPTVTVTAWISLASMVQMQRAYPTLSIVS